MLDSFQSKSAWVLFEAGALTKTLDGKACGLLLGGLTPANVTGPLAQFQHRRFSKDDFSKLLRDLNSSLDNSLEQEQLKLIFDKWWPDIEKKYNAAATADEPSKKTQERSEREIIEEILEQVRVIEKPRNTSSSSLKSKLQWSKKLIEKIVDSLPEEKKNLLKEISKFKMAKEHKKVEALSVEHKSDIEELIQQGLLTIDEDNTIRINRIFSRSFFAEGE